MGRHSLRTVPPCMLPSRPEFFTRCAFDAFSEPESLRRVNFICGDKKTGLLATRLGALIESTEGSVGLAIDQSAGSWVGAHERSIS